MRDFLSENFKGEQSRHLVAWDDVCKLKDLGRLGICNLGKKNSTLLSKWLWRFPLEKEAFLHKFIKAKYGLLDDSWDPACARPTLLEALGN